MNFSQGAKIFLVLVVSLSVFNLSNCRYFNLVTPKQPFKFDFVYESTNNDQNVKNLPSNQINFGSENTQILASGNTQILVDQAFKGQYYSNQNTNLFSYLDSKKGSIEILFYSDPLKMSKTDLNSLEVFLFDPIYHDQKAVGVLIDLGQINQNNTWTVINTKIKMVKFWKQRSEGNQQIIDGVNYTVVVSNLASGDASSVTITIQMEGPDFRFSAKLDYWHDVLSTFGYCGYVTLIVGLQIFCALMILKNVQVQNPANIAKMSLLTLSICNIQDFYLTMLHIQYIMSTGAGYLFFILPSMAYLILFVIFDMKMLFLVWRSHNMRDIQNAQALRKKLTTFYIQFYLGLFIYLTLTYFFSYDAWLILLQNLILLPQIVHNVRIGNNPGFSGYYTLGFLGLRFMLPLYQRGCPGNHFILAPMYDLVITLGLLYVIQIVILYLQAKFGPRFFIPKTFLPNYYNYNIKLKLNQENRQIQCTICLLNIFSPDPSTVSNINGSMNEALLLDEINIMKTPCNHYFHKQCLMKWIDVKLQCPTCRMALPAI